MTTDTPNLETLRDEIDRIDDRIHDLIVERAALVERISAAKSLDSVALRPGREAAILRRLMERHTGAFPKRALIRIWRELMGALLGMQRPFSVVVYQPERGAGYIDLARNHFGVVSPLVTYQTAGHVVRVVADGQASVGVVPLQTPSDAEPWWLSLTAGADNLPRVVARLPMLAEQPSPGRPEPLHAYVLACRDADPTGQDCTLVAVETAPDVSRDRLRTLMVAAQLPVLNMVAMHRSDLSWVHLAEVSEHVARDDSRLTDLVGGRDPVRHVRVIGGYAMPMAMPA